MHLKMFKLIVMFIFPPFLTETCQTFFLTSVIALREYELYAIHAAYTLLVCLRPHTN